MRALTIRPALDRISDARRFLFTFLGAVALGFCVAAMALLALDRQGLLAAPPLTATNCIDDKFAVLRGLPLDDRSLVAVGSSATWRNLDMAVFERRLPGMRAFNAAVCYLHIDQTAYLAEFILTRMPRVETVVAVVAPRDFEACRPEQTAFFDQRLAHAYLSGRLPQWLPYVTGFRPLYFAREAKRRQQERGRIEPRSHEDAYGSSVLRHVNRWSPRLRIDDRCYAGLMALESVVAAEGARLVIATTPVMPKWAAAYDPDGKAVEDWTRRIASSLRWETSLLIDGRALAWDDSRFADPVHLIYPNHRLYTEFIADKITERGTTSMVQN
jgi:hypothetical protein